MKATYDIIIVGAGTAGSVLAHRLSEDKNLAILVIEAGIDRNNDLAIKAPGASARLIGDPAYDWGFTTTEQVGLNGRVINHPRGKVLGGSSAINSHSVVYPSTEYHDAWETFGASGWTWQEIAPYYRKFQTVDLPNRDLRDSLHLEYTDNDKAPRTGPVHTSFHYVPTPIQKAWTNTYDRLGCAVKADPINGTAVGGLTIPNAIDANRGERSHAGVAYLQPSMSRTNLDLVTDAIVEKLIFAERSNVTDSLIATGIQYVKGGVLCTVECRREVVICAGTFKSPQILEMSGIGSKTLLEQHGIECLIDNRNVGENLQDHLNIGPSLEVRDGVATMDSNGRDPTFITTARETYEKSRDGPLAHGAAFNFAYQPLSLFSNNLEVAHLTSLLENIWSQPETDPRWKQQYEYITHTLQSNAPSATVFMLPRQRNADAPTLALARTASHPANFTSIIGMLSHPFSRGSVHIQSSNPHDHPKIDPKYLSHPLDVEVLKQHLLGIDRLAQCEPLSSFLKPTGEGVRLPASFPHPLENMSDEDIEAMIRRCVATNYHPTGTCAMGGDGRERSEQRREQQNVSSEQFPTAQSTDSQSTGVVDSDLRVHGTANVRVCDASVIPLIPRGNIISTVYAVAERGADLMKKSLCGGGI